MSLKKNLIANYGSQIYITLIGIAVVPLYMKYMGAEAYGLIGVFAMLQAMFNLLDLGLTPTVARETARYNGGATDTLHYRRLVRALQIIFLLVATIGGGALYVSSNTIALSWLNAGNLPIEQIDGSIKLIAVIIALRWICGVYRGVISGNERLVWLSAFNSTFATLRFFGVLPVIMFVSSAPIAFFQYQLVVAILELTILIVKAYSLLPRIEPLSNIGWSISPVKKILKFSLTIAFTTFVWILVTQIDKLVLSKLLTLEDFGYFTLAVLVASGITMVNGPVSSAIMPRMVNLEAQNEHDEMISIYRKATQIVAVVAGTVAVSVALEAKILLQLWTGNSVLVEKVSPILSIYSIGNAFLAVSAFPYYLQYAKGNLHLHLIGNVVFAIVLVPTVFFTASYYQSVGAAYAWLGINILLFFVWVPFVHYKILHDLTYRWHTQDVLIIFASAATAGLIASHQLKSMIMIPNGILRLVLILFSTLFAAILSSSYLRTKIVDTTRKLRKQWHN